MKDPGWGLSLIFNVEFQFIESTVVPRYSIVRSLLLLHLSLGMNDDDLRDLEDDDVDEDEEDEGDASLDEAEAKAKPPNDRQDEKRNKYPHEDCKVPPAFRAKAEAILQVTYSLFL